MAASEKDLPIGRCKPGTEILIDENNGEIIIKGNTVSKGYFRDAEKRRRPSLLQRMGSLATGLEMRDILKEICSITEDE